MGRYNADRAARIKAALDQIKLELGCQDCGYRKEATRLHFDYQEMKIWNVARMVWSNYSVERIMTEITKCEIRCDSCHHKRHAASRLRWIRGRFL